MGISITAQTDARKAPPKFPFIFCNITGLKNIFFTNDSIYSGGLTC
jgi:hypothetical protein